MVASSEAGPTASNVISTLAQEPPLLKFPPFPEPPAGVTIMPFKRFKPRGIQLFSEHTREKNDSGDEEDAELDALGIPTVELRVKHSTDVCKSNPRKRRKKKKAAVVEAVPVKKSHWYDEWEEGEDLRVTKVRYDASVSPVDRFYESAHDFRTGRPWPPVSSGLNNLWDQFRLFTGLLVNPSVFRKAGGKKNVRAESPDFESDDEDDVTMDVEEAPATKETRPTKRQRPEEGLDEDHEDDPQKLDEELREEKITAFLSDPEREVRIFLSSHMRERGLIWNDRNLVYTPRLVYFFLAFVLRNRVLPEPRYQRGLKRALEMIESAKKELPLTHKVGQTIPDAINEALREFFGRKGGMNWSVVNATSIPAEQKDPSMTVTDMSSGVKTKMALPTERQTQLKDAIEDNVDMEVSFASPITDAVPVNENTGGWGDGWGDGDSGWGGGGWGDQGTPDQNAWANQEGQGTNGGATWADAKWADTNPSWNRDPPSLMSLLGPSSFPLTHTTGIVECSTRRVSAIYFPPNHPKAASSPSLKENLAEISAGAGEGQDWIPSASGVEAEFDARFAKVILKPWGREEGDIAGPEIWATSRGPVTNSSSSEEVSASAGRRPHNPLTDSITLLVEPSLAEMLALVPGLGLGAMWIEIARQKRGVDGAPEVDTSTPGRFWYHEDVTGIFPSFYTPRGK